MKIDMGDVFDRYCRKCIHCVELGTTGPYAISTAKLCALCKPQNNIGILNWHEGFYLNPNFVWPETCPYRLEVILENDSK